MEIALWIVVAGTAILLVIAGVKAWERKKKRDAEAEQAAAKKAGSAAKKAGSAAKDAWSKSVGMNKGVLRGSTNMSSTTHYGASAAPQPAVQQNSGIDPLMAGLIGYGLAGGFSGHSNASGGNNLPSAPLESCKPEERTSYSGSSDDGGNSYSGSSDSGSSYDSGSSGGGDSGGSSGGGGD